MSKSRGGLGRGLAALIPTGPQTNTVADVLLGDTSRPASPPAGPGPSELDGSVPVAVGGATSGDPATSAGISGAPGGMPGAAPDQPGWPSTATPDGPRYAEVPVGAIRPNPRNPRTVFDQDALDELAHSIREFGLLQPVVVRPVEGGYELVMGERRWRAAQQAGVATVSAIVRRTEDADLLRDALLENIHRTNLNPLEEAAAYQQLLEEFEVTHDELASRLGRSRPVISNTIRLLNLPIAVQRRVAAGVLSAGHARALLALSDPGDQEDLAARIVAEGLSVRGAEEAVTLLARRKPTVRRSPPRKMIMPGVQELAINLSDAFDTRVLVELGRRKGKIVVEFATVDDLERLVGIMAPVVAQRRRGAGAGPTAGQGVVDRPTAERSGLADRTAQGITGGATGYGPPPDDGRRADLYEVTAGGFAVTGAGSPDPRPPADPSGPMGQDVQPVHEGDAPGSARPSGGENPPAAGDQGAATSPAATDRSEDPESVASPPEPAIS